ncbi:MAG: cyclase family protein [Alphaproteobacteria bacterium]|nr:cyclase family protein [Alphaproteobacteria bacterium]
MTNPRWKHRPEGSTWGDWGPDDELGRLNLLTPGKVLQGIAEVKTGRTFCLSLPLDYPGGAILSPRRHPPELRPTMREGLPNMNVPLRCFDPTATDIVSDDQVVLTLQYSTQWDTLAHVGQMFDADGDGYPEDVYYNGFRPGHDVVGSVMWDRAGKPTPTASGKHVGAKHLGVEKIAETCVQGRAVMIDLAAHFGRSGHLVGYEDLMGILEKDKVVVELGDMVCLRTGFAELLLEMKKQPDRDVLFSGEMWYFTELADWLRGEGRNRFLLTAPPLRLPGAVGSPATPVATV